MDLRGEGKVVGKEEGEGNENLRELLVELEEGQRWRARKDILIKGAIMG